MEHTLLCISPEMRLQRVPASYNILLTQPFKPSAATSAFPQEQVKAPDLQLPFPISSATHSSNLSKGERRQ